MNLSKHALMCLVLGLSALCNTVDASSVADFIDFDYCDGGTGTCLECEGDCTVDADCAGSLQCAGSSNPKDINTAWDERRAYCTGDVPSRLNSDSGWNAEFCYDPLYVLPTQLCVSLTDDNIAPSGDAFTSTLHTLPIHNDPNHLNDEVYGNGSSIIVLDSDSNANRYAGIDFGLPTYLKRIEISRGAVDNRPLGSGYQVEVSTDGINYTPVSGMQAYILGTCDAYTGQNLGNTGKAEISFDIIQIQFIRISNMLNGAAIDEMTVYQTQPSPPICP
jgi:hypothetical protein